MKIKIKHKDTHESNMKYIIMFPCFKVLLLATLVAYLRRALEGLISPISPRLCCPVPNVNFQ